MSNIKELLIRIEYLRKRMTEIALKKGFTSAESISISQELDKLMNDYEVQKVKNYDKISPFIEK
ncbi:aspartyl-phosphate phosphatase Spo0E family protein [Radiobacillus deserti]|uniref:Aspartyl-phosphate phosphatase Spo0E family protein n=1 Tax=Radiobacillus deserti TaxID=2594883 RepID=A0A516KF31_9BACI|nr:aspartyl-phosphate phosphatase Spo0E family protein [Radiobacillus deserti]QDP40022.1 aspartyl-phosphate phosphatase Spo0E family protein [Radiobacillus deserti]